MTDPILPENLTPHTSGEEVAIPVPSAVVLPSLEGSPQTGVDFYADAQRGAVLWPNDSPVAFLKGIWRVTRGALEKGGELPEEIAAIFNQWSLGEAFPPLEILSVIAYFELMREKSMGLLDAYPFVLFFGQLQQLPALPGTKNGEVLTRFLEGYRGRREAFDQLMEFLYVDDSRKDPFYSALTFEENLQLIEGRAALHQRLGRRAYRHVPDHMMMMYGDRRPPEGTGIAETAIGDGPFRFKVMQGEAENSMGLEYRVIHAGKTVAKVGVEYSTRGAHILNIQGEPGALESIGTFRDQLGQHPFDWLIGQIIIYAREAGLEYVRGYGYQRNGSIMQHLNLRDITTKARTFRNMYDRRFERLGFTPLAGVDSVYELLFDRSASHPSPSNEGAQASRATVSAGISTYVPTSAEAMAGRPKLPSSNTLPSAKTENIEPQASDPPALSFHIVGAVEYGNLPSSTPLKPDFNIVAAHEDEESHLPSSSGADETDKSPDANQPPLSLSIVGKTTPTLMRSTMLRFMVVK